MIRHLMDQHGLTRADMVPILGTPSRVSEVLGALRIHHGLRGQDVLGRQLRDRILGQTRCTGDEVGELRHVDRRQVAHGLVLHRLVALGDTVGVVDEEAVVGAPDLVELVLRGIAI